jgi:acyl carrier protein
MDLLAVLAGLKSRLGIDVPAADAARMATVNSAVTVLRELLP